MSARDKAAGAPDEDRLRRWRLAAQKLTPASAAADPVAAARAVVGIQAQDVRAAGLALRSRVRGLDRRTLDDSRLVRVWTVRGTAHLIDETDLPWLHAVTGPGNRRYYDNLMAKRGSLASARALLPELVAVLEEGARDRPSLLAELRARGCPDLIPSSVNILMPWATAHGVVRGLPDGRLQASQPPPAVDRDEALATLGRRYLAGYGPATAADLAKWSGLGLRVARRAIEAAGDVDRAGGLLAPAGTFDADPPEAPDALLLAPFDTLLLGYRTREPFVAAQDDARILPGGGMVRAVVLIHGVARGTWRVVDSGRRRSLSVEWFDDVVAGEALEGEADDVARFLGFDELTLAV